MTAPRRTAPPLEAEPEPIGGWVTFACGCTQHVAYLPVVAIGEWITHFGPAPGRCQTSARVTGLEPCAGPCGYCSAARIERWRRQRKPARTEPNPDQPAEPIGDTPPSSAETTAPASPARYDR